MSITANEIRIESERVVLKPLSLNDAPVLFDYRSRPEIYRYQSWFPENLVEAVAFITLYSVDSVIEIGRWKQLGIYARSGAVLLGDCGFCVQADGQAEIGYTISPQYQRKGFGQEAVQALTEYLFRTIRLRRLTAKTDPDNMGSIRLLKKAGFRQEALIRKNVKIRGEWKDDLIFTLIRKSGEIN